VEEGPDPDEALGTLNWHLGDLVDEADLPSGLDPSPRAHDGVNFINFDDFPTGDQPDITGSETDPAAEESQE
jgi:hypothetical protein